MAIEAYLTQREGHTGADLDREQDHTPRPTPPHTTAYLDREQYHEGLSNQTVLTVFVELLDLVINGQRING